jgi:hypothetical protein
METQIDATHPSTECRVPMRGLQYVARAGQQTKTRVVATHLPVERPVSIWVLQCAVQTIQQVTARMIQQVAAQTKTQTGAAHPSYLSVKYPAST